MPRRSAAAFLVALFTLVCSTLVAVAGPALAATGSPGSTANLSDNPILATNLTGWTTNAGGSALSRVAVTDHVAASFTAQTTSSASTTRVRMPTEPITTAGAWTYAADVKAQKVGATASVSVAFYNASGGFVANVESSFVPVNATNWTRVAHVATPPVGAASGQAQVNVVGTAKSNTVQVTQHDVRAPVVATTTTTPPPTTTTTVPPTTTDPPPTSTTTPVTTTTPTTTTTPPPPPPGVTLTPTQPVGFIYGGTPQAAYAQPGAMVVAGRDNYNAPAFQNVSAAGGHVLIYLDPIIDNTSGRYHQLLIPASECGPAVARWPGSPQANQWGYLNDFRVGSPLHAKLDCVLEKMVAENPHMAGWFIDDLGSRSWFPNFNWDTFGTSNQQAYRDGAIAVAQTVRTVANRHGLMFVVNGTWAGGTLAASGGGYPNMSSHGLSLAEGGVIEHHAVDQFWLNYSATTAQWGAGSPITGPGKPVMLVIGSADSERQAWVNAGLAYYTTQSSYDTAPTPWGPFHPTGLPSHAA